jgi:hypothetical protein
MLAHQKQNRKYIEQNVIVCINLDSAEIVLCCNNQSHA